MLIKKIATISLLVAVTATYGSEKYVAKQLQEYEKNVTFCINRLFAAVFCDNAFHALRYSQVLYNLREHLAAESARQSRDELITSINDAFARTNAFTRFTPGIAIRARASAIEQSSLSEAKWHAYNTCSSAVQHAVISIRNGMAKVGHAPTSPELATLLGQALAARNAVNAQDDRYELVDQLYQTMKKKCVARNHTFTQAPAQKKSHSVEELI